MRKTLISTIAVLFLSGMYSEAFAQYNSSNYSRSNTRNSYSSSYHSSRSADYPLSCNMLGLVGGIFLTSNPDMSGYDTKKNYTDYGGGMVFDYRREFSENSAFEFLMSGMLASCKTSHTEEGEDKLKVTFPVEFRFYLGNSFLKLYVGAGLQYNFIWSLKDTDRPDYYYGGSDVDSGTGAHQLSGNGSVGLCVLGLSSRIHFLLGTKFHFPIINNAEGVDYSNGSKIDFSKDKTSIAATAGVSVDVVRQKIVWMTNYDYPLGSTKRTSVTTGDTRNFFERKSMSLTTSFLFVL